MSNDTSCNLLSNSFLGFSLKKFGVSFQVLALNLENALILSYTGGGGGEGGMPAQISKIRIFVINTAAASKFGDFS